MNTGQTGHRGIDFTLPVAKALGQVMYFVRSHHYPLDFMIQAPGYLGLIGLRRSRKIHATLAEIDRQFARIIAEIRMCPAGGPVSRELWLYSRHGALRFIRVTATGIEEIDRQVILCRPDVPAEPAENPPRVRKVRQQWYRRMGTMERNSSGGSRSAARRYAVTP